MGRKSRQRQLKKAAERRVQERRRRRRQRILVVSVAGAVAAAGIGFAGVAFLGGREEGRPRAGPTPGPSVTTSPTVAGGVACGGEVPGAAGEEKAMYDKPPKMRIDPDKRYSALLRTSCGDVELELFAKETPVTVNNFVFLAREGFYDGLTFHRLETDFVIQGGDPAGDGTGGPGYQFEDELDNKLRYELGTLAMANSDPDTNESQFFIIIGPQGETLPKQYTIFGKVVKGLDVLETLNALPTEPDPDGQTHHPVQTVHIERVRITER